MILGYNTNGFAHHRLEDAICIIAENGYRGIALTPDVHNFCQISAGTGTSSLPLAPIQQADWAWCAERLRGVAVVIETGARFLLSSRHKHQPTLVSHQHMQRHERLDMLRSCVDLATEVGSDCVSFWSGTPTDDAPDTELMSRLVDGCKRLADHAADRNVRLAFEPEPGMFIDTMPKFEELHARVNHSAFGLTLDVGHLVCMGETPASAHIRRWKDWLWNVHLDDMRPGVHDHLMFGEGEVDFADVFAGLREIGYQGMASVELSRHSHDAVTTARRSMAFLSPFLGERRV